MVKQTWECPICGWVYESPMRVREVLCPKEHTAAQLAAVTGMTSHARGRAGKAAMRLVQGELPNEPKRRKAVVDGKQELRRA